VIYEWGGLNMLRRECSKWPLRLAFAVGSVYLLLAIFQRLIIYDEGLVIYSAERVARGEIPYRDFWAVYAPAQFYTLAGIFRLFGFSILTERVWDTVTRLTLCIVLLMVSRRLLTKGSVYLPVLVILLFLSSCGGYGYPVIPAMLFILVSILFLLQSFNRRAYFLLFMSGFVTGISILYRQDYGVYTFMGTGIAMLLFPFTIARSRLKEVITKAGASLLIYTAGTAAIVLPIVLYFVETVHISELRADFVGHAVLYTRSFSRQLHLPPLLPGPHDFISGLLLDGVWFIFYVPLAVYLVSWSRVIRSLRDRARTPGPEDQRFGLILLAALGSMFLIPAVMRPDLIHCFAMTVPVTILLPMLLVEWFAAKPPAWKRTAVAFSLAVLAFPYAVVPFAKWCVTLSDFAPWKSVSTLQRAHYFRVDADQERAVHFVQQSVPAGQSIFVGNSQHHQVFVNDALFYFLAERPAGTRFHLFAPGVITEAPAQREVVSELQKNHVNLLVLRSGLDRSENAKEVPVDSGVTILDNFIREEYQPIQAFGDYSIWRKY
jgi:hypothetical protein